MVTWSMGEIPELPPAFIAAMRKEYYERACTQAWGSIARSWEYVVDGQRLTL